MVKMTRRRGSGRPSPANHSPQSAGQSSSRCRSACEGASAARIRAASAKRVERVAQAVRFTPACSPGSTVRPAFTYAIRAGTLPCHPQSVASDREPGTAPTARQEGRGARAARDGQAVTGDEPRKLERPALIPGTPRALAERRSPERREPAMPRPTSPAGISVCAKIQGRPSQVSSISRTKAALPDASSTAGHTARGGARFRDHGEPGLSRRSRHEGGPSAAGGRAATRKPRVDRGHEFFQALGPSGGRSRIRTGAVCPFILAVPGPGAIQRRFSG